MVEFDFFAKSLGGQSGRFCAFAFGRHPVFVHNGFSGYMISRDFVNTGLHSFQLAGSLRDFT